ncbi:hypothetical protein GWI33_017636 [Rhynchophorus ferrugineus]|uniref:Uncharacterized protein n=1 Tax=Rhynchophorus ferrugineus TaxID=354439 RepID=A0A834HY22_RHYFE|nr:hypothetical protein GWI33_017636 [Rhynchophorus ferrugineus]
MKPDKLKLVHFNNNDRAQAPVHKEVPGTKSAAGTPKNYDNLLLFYLTKLKRLFSSQVSQNCRENSVDSTSRTRSQRVCHRPRTPIPPPSLNADDIQSKVYKVVSAAIEYGFANNVLERKGDCFVLKNQSPYAYIKQPMPCRRYCDRCCNMHKMTGGVPDARHGCGSRFSDRRFHPNLISEKPLRTIHERRIHKHCKPTQNLPAPIGTKKKLKAKIQHCPECKALERNKLHH